MALNNLGLGFVFTARNLASGTIGRLRGEVAGLGGASQRSGLAMRAGFGLAAAGVAPLVAGVTGLATALNLAASAAAFEQGVQRVANISGATTEELQQLRDAAVAAGLASGFTPTQAIEGLTELASRGFTAAESMTHLNQSLLLAEGGQISIQQATEATGSAIRVFGLQGEEAALVADRLLQATNATALQANDLALALGTVSRGAGQAHQSLSEMLIAMGLVRNAGVDASVAASSVSSALQFMARNATDFAAIGVNITDPITGQFRDFIDVVLETDTALSERYTNAAERATAATELFGRFGITAFQNVAQQIRDGIRTSEGELLRGADAVDHLRASMENAGGVAEEFRDRLLDTFAGQATLLRGAIDTLVIVLGEPFARVFKPIVRALVVGFTALVRAFDALPDTFQTAAAGIFVGVSAFMALAGAMTIVSGLAVAIAPFILGIAKVMFVLAIAMAPAIIATLAFGAALAVVVAAVQNNLGGLGDRWRRFMSQIQLGWEALTQLFTRGGLSESVFQELNRAENRGLRGFVIRIFQLGFRFMRFWEGLREGFGQTISRLGPVFNQIGGALERLGRSFGLVEEAGVDLTNVGSSRFAAFGARVGVSLGRVVEGIARFVAFSIDVVIGMVTTMQETWSVVSPFVMNLVHSFQDLGRSLAALFAEFGMKSKKGSSDAENFGATIGVILNGLIIGTAAFVNGIVVTIRVGVEAVRMFMRIWNELHDTVIGVSLGIQHTFFDMIDSVMNAIDGMVSYLGSLMSRIPAQFRPDFAADLIAAGQEADTRVATRTAEANRRHVAVKRVREQMTGRATAFEAEAEQRTQADNATAEAVARAMESQRVRDVKEREERPLQINVQVDGETIARATNEGNRREGARGFVPVPSEAG